MTKKNPRNHGYGKPPEVKGIPEVGDRAEGVPACPHCGCETLFYITVELEEDNSDPGIRALRKPEGPYQIKGRYIGCPACPWASPMMTSAVPKKDG